MVQQTRRRGKAPPRPRHVAKPPPPLPRMMFHLRAEPVWPQLVADYRQQGRKVLTAEEAAPLVGKSARQLVDEWVAPLRYFLPPAVMAAHVQAEKDAADRHGAKGAR